MNYPISRDVAVNYDDVTMWRLERDVNRRCSGVNYSGVDSTT